MELTYTEKRLKELDSQQRNGMYTVSKVEGLWRIKGRATQVNTRYAAVNGQSNNLDKAAWLMGEHLSHRYGAVVNEFTLFHNRTYGGGVDTLQSAVNKFKPTRTAKELYQVMHNSQQRGLEVYWMGHSQGAIMIFSAVKMHVGGFFKNMAAKVSDGISKVGAATLVGTGEAAGLLEPGSYEASHQAINDARASAIPPWDMHHVALHGAGTNQQEVKKLFKKAGVILEADVSHPLDLVNSIAGGNAKVGSIDRRGSLLFSQHIKKGVPSQSAHTLPYENMDIWIERMLSGHKDFAEDFGTGFSVKQRAFLQKHKTELIEAAKRRNYMRIKAVSIE